jgi:glycosyltransferase involved in cell wall biosynthesis
MKPTLPLVSIIVPVHDGARTLPAALGAIAASDLPREMWELIVVDDASTDDTAMVSAQFADCVVRLPGRPHGPAYARNRGVEVSRGPIIAFATPTYACTRMRFAASSTCSPTSPT